MPSTGFMGAFTWDRIAGDWRRRDGTTANGILSRLGEAASGVTSSIDGGLARAFAWALF